MKGKKLLKRIFYIIGVIVLVVLALFVKLGRASIQRWFGSSTSENPASPILIVIMILLAVIISWISIRRRKMRWIRK